MIPENKDQLIIDFGKDFGDFSKEDITAFSKETNLSPQEILELFSTLKNSLEPLGFKVLISD